MTPTQKLLESAKRVLRRDTQDTNAFDDLEAAIIEVEAEPEPWTPPWPLKIPDWPNVWFCVDLDGEGVFFQLEPHVCEESEIHYQRGEVMYVGYFEIPPGVDWRTLKVQVKKDGVLL